MVCSSAATRKPSASLRVSPPNGIVLYGPPGAGKTHFARAIAGELGHPYLKLSAGNIKSKWVNESTEKVNQLFTEGEQFDRCVIFVDEIDALLAGRGDNLHREHAQVVNEFLAHLDEVDPNFLLIAATNRADPLMTPPRAVADLTNNTRFRFQT
jgi:SpoVK/Ycf46/Vps4 family AAA+-type ATPase